MLNKTLTGGALALLLITGCTDRTEEVETPAIVENDAFASFQSVLDDTLSLSDAQEADLTALVAAMPDYASLTWENQNFEASSGATVFEGLAIGFGEDPKFGLRFDEAKIWGLETELLTARLGGERLSESGPLFTRLEGTNVSYFGVAQAINTMLENLVLDLDPEFPDAFELGFDQLSSETERFVMVGAALRPWELSLVTPDALSVLDEEIPEEGLAAAHIGQQFIAVVRSISVDQMVSTGTQAVIEMRQPGATVEASYSMAFAGASDVRGFDVGTNVVRDASGTQTSAYEGDLSPDELIAMTGFPSGLTLAQAESYATASITDLRLDKVMGYLARAELPSMDERDLLSLGRWEVTDYRTELNDKEILTADRAYFNGDSFEWVIPSDFNLGVSGATLNTGELTGFFKILFETFMNEAMLDEMDEDERTQVEQVREGVDKAIELLPEHGLDTLPFDFDLSMSWDADQGPSDFGLVFDADGYGRTAMALALDLPTYDAAKAAYEAEDQDAAFETAFEDGFAFRGASYSEEDKGAYDKLFGFAHAIGKEYPNEGWGAVLGSMEPAQLRSYLGTIMRMAKPGAEQDFPPAAEWIESFATYLETGGRIEFASQPPVPITRALIDQFDDQDPEPDEIVELFGLTVTHTK